MFYKCIKYNKLCIHVPGINELKQNCARNFTISMVLLIFTSHGWWSVVFLYSPWIVTPGLWRWVLQFVLSVWIRKWICFWSAKNFSLLKKIFLNFFKAAADEKIKEQLTGSAAGTGSKTHQEQLQFSNAIKDIESSSFIQSSFVSNRYVRGFASIFSKKKLVCFYKDYHLELTLLKHLSLQIFVHCEPVLTHL